MKRIIKWTFRPFWRATSPVRRAVMARFDARTAELISGTVNARMMPPIIEALAISGHRLERIEESLDRADRAASNLAEEVDLVLNGLSREIFRLQAQLEMLQRSLGEDDRATGNGLSIVAESGDDAPLRRSPAPAERSRVG